MVFRALLYIHNWLYCVRFLLIFCYSKYWLITVTTKIHFHYFQEGNNYGTDYHDYTFINNPLLRIKVTAHPGSTNLTFDPTLEQTRVLIKKWFHIIIHVNSHIPSVDKMMYPGKTLYCFFSVLKCPIAGQWLLFRKLKSFMGTRRQTIWRPTWWEVLMRCQLCTLPVIQSETQRTEIGTVLPTPAHSHRQ